MVSNQNLNNDTENEKPHELQTMIRFSFMVLFIGIFFEAFIYYTLAEKDLNTARQLRKLIMYPVIYIVCMIELFMWVGWFVDRRNYNRKQQKEIQSKLN